MKPGEYIELLEEWFGDEWVEPHSTISHQGEKVYEWWSHKKKLVLYLSDDGSKQYVKVWGPDMDLEMEEGDFESFYGLWDWLWC